MSLTAEETSALEQELDTTEETTTAPASGEQPAEGTPAEPTELEEGSTTEAEGDEPKDGKEKPTEQQGAWKQVAAAKREQVRVAQARQKLEQDAERVRSYEAELEQRATQLQSRVQELDTREQRLRPLEEALESRDLHALIALGFDYDAFTRENIDANTPAGVARRALEENRKLRERLDADKKAQEDREKQQAQIAETRHIAQTLVQIVDESAEQLPELYEWTPERIAQEGLELRAAFFRRNRRPPTYEQVVNELSRRAKAEADVRTQRTTALQQRKSANPSGAGSAGNAVNKGTSGSPTTPALTGPTANERSSPPRQKTEEEIDAECLADLRGLRR